MVQDSFAGCIDQAYRGAGELKVSLGLERSQKLLYHVLFKEGGRFLKLKDPTAQFPH